MNPPPLSNVPPAVAPKPRTSVLAVLSLVFGVLGCTSLIGIICGIVALVKIRRSGGQLGGKGLAVAGLIVSSVMLLIALAAAVVLPIIARAHQPWQPTQPAMNPNPLPVSHAVEEVEERLEQLQAAALKQVSADSGRLLAATNWCDVLRPVLGGEAEKILRHPAHGEGSACGFGYNALLAGRPAAGVDPATVMFFELETPRCNAAGGPELLRQPRHGGDTQVVVLADGYVLRVAAGDLSGLRWQP